MPHLVTIILGRLVQAAASLRGGGSALPGLVVERLEPQFAARVLAQLPQGVVLVSGTNGKTTTVKVVCELLEAAGLKVFTNNTGSNFMRGVNSSLLRKVSLTGTLNADIAVLELDEAHAVSFVEAVPPRYSLLLNVMRDQLDRFGEIDYTARLLAAVARATTRVVVLNREDSRLAALPELEQLAAQVQWFGLAPELRSEFPEDDALYDEAKETGVVGEVGEVGGWASQAEHRICRVGEAGEASGAKGSGTAKAADEAAQPCKNPTARPLAPPTDWHLASSTACPPTLLIGHANNTATIELEGTAYQAHLALKGVHNVFNATAALALAHAITPTTPAKVLIAALERAQPAFGRGEALVVNGATVELVLVKNPGGFRLALRGHSEGHFGHPEECFGHSVGHPEGYSEGHFEGQSAVMIAINDDYADGRDMSWLFDVDFTALNTTGVDMVSGVRAHDMALRLAYDEVPFAVVEPELSTALEHFLAMAKGRPARIYCTYTAMLALRRLLGAKTRVERIK